MSKLSAEDKAQRRYWETFFAEQIKAAAQYEKVAFANTPVQAPTTVTMAATQSSETPWEETDPWAAATARELRMQAHWRQQHARGEYDDLLRQSAVGRRRLAEKKAERERASMAARPDLLERTFTGRRALAKQPGNQTMTSAYPGMRIEQLALTELGRRRLREVYGTDDVQAIRARELGEHHS